MSVTPGWRIQAKKLHLTYPTHLPFESLLRFLTGVLGELESYSLVHENGKQPEVQITTEIDSSNRSAAAGTTLPSGTLATSGAAAAETIANPGLVPTIFSGNTVPYAHTHVLLHLKQKWSSRNARALDFEALHPNIHVVTTDLHYRNVWKYHEKDPVALKRSVPPVDRKCPAHLQNLIKAKSLAEAIQLANLEIKSVSDLVHLRRSREELQYEIPKIIGERTWNMDFIRFNNKVVVLTGISGAGKTRFGLAHFEEPLLVSMMEDLKRLEVRHTGIVFDDVSFAGYTLEQCIHLCDLEMPRTINVKHGSVTIPAGLPRIITTNKPIEDLFPPDPAGALRRRIHVVHVVNKLYSEVDIIPGWNEQDMAWMESIWPAALAAEATGAGAGVHALVHADDEFDL